MSMRAEFVRINAEACGDYFVGYNSSKGFVGSYDRLVKEGNLKRLYIIKGAAGTGKSTLMKTVAAEAAKAGKRVERFSCGSDPASLDLVIINSSVAVLDGTSPHELELQYPGAVSHLIDHTRLWNNDMLRLRRQEVIELTERKREAYDTAYNQLKVHEALMKESASALKGVVNTPKLEKSVSRIIKSLGKPNGRGEIKEKTLRSIGMKGCYGLDTFEKLAKSVIEVADVYGSADYYMSTAVKMLSGAGFDVEISRDPTFTDRICEILVPQTSLLITTEATKTPERRVNMNRFIFSDRLAEKRGWLRLSAKCAAMVLDEAQKSLAEAGRAHFGLEKIYSSAMDFAALGELTRQLCDEITTLV